MKVFTFCVFLFLAISSFRSLAQVPGGGTGTGPDVTVTDNGATVTLNNGIVSFTVTKASATITNLTYNGTNLLSGGYNGGQVYWSWNMPNYQNPANCTYTLNADPSTNGGNYAEIQLHIAWDGTSATAAMDVDVYYSLPRGAQGVYASAMLTHPVSYPANPGGEWRMASYPNPTFDWLSVDSLRNRKMATLADWNAGTQPSGAPPEVRLLHTGIYTNQYECKYDYSADFGDIDVWGWSSTTQNLGIWVTAPSKEYYNGGPMKRELMCHNSPTMLNMLNGQHYGMGTDGAVAAGENWQKVFGPFLIYCNSVPSGTSNAWAALWADAKAQAKAEQSAWPYNWYTNPAYIKESGRGTITGTLAINDISNPAASPANMWVGVAIPPPSTKNITDFQLWSKNYQFWVKADANGNFTIPHVLPGTYNLYAFGPGAAGTMTQTAYVTVTAGNTSNLGTVTWTPVRTAPTVWEIGIPDRNAKEFRHGNDWWRSDTFPSTSWGKFMDYTKEFPNDVNYTIGQSNPATDWNFVQPYDKSVQSTSPNWKVNFNLASDPTSGSTAAVYTAFAASYTSALIINVNGTNITTPSTGVIPANPSDAMVRKGIHGAFSDYRFTFPAGYLHAGANQISFTERITGGGTTGDIMYDYVRLEASGTSEQQIPLPVYLKSLTVTKENKTNVLQWATVSESNSSYFEVQQSSDGINFHALGKVAAQGNSSVKVDYHFTDNHPAQGWNYYRVKEVDIDGQSLFSNIVRTNFTNTHTALSLYPNPVSTVLTAEFFTTDNNTAKCTITDAKGVTVKTFTINTQAGNNLFQINIADMTAGNYLLNIYGNSQMLSSKFVKF